MLSLPRFLSSLFMGASLGVASCFPISTIEFVPSEDSLKVIEIIFDEPFKERYAKSLQGRAISISSHCISSRVMSYFP